VRDWATVSELLRQIKSRCGFARRAEIFAAPVQFEGGEEAKCAISVAIGGKADMGCCTAYVR